MVLHSFSPSVTYFFPLTNDPGYHKREEQNRSKGQKGGRWSWEVGPWWLLCPAVCSHSELRWEGRWMDSPKVSWSMGTGR